MTYPSYDRDSLIRYGVEDQHTHVCTIISHDRQSEMVLGLGTDHDSAVTEARREADNAGIDLSDGRLLVYRIA